jgi:hypothetical protein
VRASQLIVRDQDHGRSILLAGNSSIDAGQYLSPKHVLKTVFMNAGEDDVLDTGYSNYRCCLYVVVT